MSDDGAMGLIQKALKLIPIVATRAQALAGTAINAFITPDVYQSVTNELLRNNIPLVPIEDLGGKGDYDPGTNVGTDNSAAFAEAKRLKVGVRLKPQGKYLIKSKITTYSGMTIQGDNAYTPEIYCDFATSGVKMIHTDPTDPIRQSNISLKGFKVMRIGNNAEHGVMIDNVDNLYVDIQVIATTSAKGGAIAVSTFYPNHRPSTNVYVHADKVTFGGNFGVQFGNVDKGYVDGSFENCQREVVGIEPYVLAYFDIVQSDVTNSTFTKTAHGLNTGDPMMYSRQGETAITGMGRVSYYFAIRIDANTFKLASSKIEAFMGTALTISSFTNTHRLYACGTNSRCVVGPVRLNCGDVPSAGSTTGSIIITASSGGYHEDLVILPPTVTERNATSGHAAITVVGAQNIRIDGLISSGQKNSAVRVAPATLKGLDFPNGRKDPSQQDGSAFAAACVPTAVIRGVQAREFGNIGIYVEDGTVLIEDCDLRSSTSTKAAIGVTAQARARGTRVRNNTVSVPNGVGVAVVDSAETVLGPLRLGEEGTTNLNKPNNRRDSPGRAQTREFGEVTVLDVSTTDVLTLCAADGTTDTYTGLIYVQAWQNDVGNSNHAAYLLHVGKGFAAGTPTVSQISSTGLVDGLSSSRPSFTWSMNGNNLKATPVGSTDAARANGWFFKFHTQGDLSTQLSF